MRLLSSQKELTLSTNGGMISEMMEFAAMAKQTSWIREYLWLFLTENPLMDFLYKSEKNEQDLCF